MFKQAKIKLLRWPFQRPDLKPKGNLWTAKKPGPLQETNQFQWSLRPLLCREVNHPTRMFPFCAHIYLPVGLELNWKKNSKLCNQFLLGLLGFFFKSNLGCMLDNHSALGKEKSTIYLFIFFYFFGRKVHNYRNIHAHDDVCKLMTIYYIFHHKLPAVYNKKRQK